MGEQPGSGTVHKPNTWLGKQERGESGIYIVDASPRWVGALGLGGEHHQLGSPKN